MEPCPNGLQSCRKEDGPQEWDCSCFFSARRSIPFTVLPAATQALGHVSKRFLRRLQQMQELRQTLSLAVRNEPIPIRAFDFLPGLLMEVEPVATLPFQLLKRSSGSVTGDGIAWSPAGAQTLRGIMLLDR